MKKKYVCKTYPSIYLESMKRTFEYNKIYNLDNTELTREFLDLLRLNVFELFSQNAISAYTSPNPANVANPRDNRYFREVPSVYIKPASDDTPRVHEPVVSEEKVDSKKKRKSRSK